jgi:hypothetical protein
MFTINTANIEEQIAHGTGYITSEVAVAGFWGNPITIRIKREWNLRDENAVAWSFSVSHSTGGTEPGTDSLVTERAFATALLAACDYVELMKARSAELEAAYQARIEIERAEAAAQRATAEAKFAADPALGTEFATAHLTALRNAVKAPEGLSVKVLRAQARGSDKVTEFVALRNWNGNVVLRVNGSSMSLKAAVARLAAQSATGVTQVDLTDDELQLYRRRYL